MTEINMNEITSALKEIRSEFEKKSVNQEKVAKLEAILEKQEDKEKNTSKRGAYYYKFIEDRYMQFIKEGSNFLLDVN